MKGFVSIDKVCVAGVCVENQSFAEATKVKFDHNINIKHYKRFLFEHHWMGADGKVDFESFVGEGDAFFVVVVRQKITMDAHRSPAIISSARIVHARLKMPATLV